MVILSIFILIILLSIITSLCYKQKYPNECFVDPVLSKLRKDLIKVDPRAVNFQIFPNTESYTENKQKIYMCIKDLDGNYYKYNHLLAVGLHELAHAVCGVVDPKHETPEFNNIHNDLRKRAIELNLLDPNDPVPPTYCPRTE